MQYVWYNYNFRCKFVFYWSRSLAGLLFRIFPPAIDLAKNGFKASKALDDALKTTKGIEEDIRNDPGLRSEIFIIAVSKAVCVYENSG